MNELKVTSDWLAWFQKESIEAVTTIDNREMKRVSIKKELVGNYVNYRTILAVIDKFCEVFGWIAVNEIRLEYSNEIEQAGLQFYTGGEYTAWRDQVLRDFYSISPVKDDYVDSSQIYCNYRVNANGVSTFLYSHGGLDVIDFFVHYDKDNDRTVYTIEAEVRKILFEVDGFEVNLPEEYLNHNSKLLQSAIAEMNAYQFVLS
jgi:hypothetical protein